MLKCWLVILSTVSFGDVVEVSAEIVYGDTSAEAERSMQARGLDTMLGWKYERLEPITENR
jgi:hypothetical protein